MIAISLQLPQRVLFEEVSIKTALTSALMHVRALFYQYYLR